MVLRSDSWRSSWRRVAAAISPPHQSCNTPALWSCRWFTGSRLRVVSDGFVQNYTLTLRIGVESADREIVASQKTEAVLLPFGSSSVELIEPKGNEGLTKFLEKRGPGLHHIAIEVEGIEAALELLESLNVPLIDKTPRVGARGHKVAFVHPRATGGVLVELVQLAHAPASD